MYVQVGCAYTANIYICMAHVICNCIRMHRSENVCGCLLTAYTILD